MGWIGGPLEWVMLEQPARWMGGCAGMQVQSTFLLPNVFLVCTPKKPKKHLFCQILCCVKAWGSSPSWWSEGLRRGLGTRDPLPWPRRDVLRGAKPGSCSSQLQPSTPGAWQELPWPGAVPGAHHGSFNLPGYSALPGSPCGWAGPERTLVRLSGNRKFSFSAWQASLVLLLESKPSCLFGKWKSQAIEYNLEFYISVMELVNLKKRHLFSMWLRYVGLIHNLSLCEQGCETTLKVDLYYFYHIPPLPWNSISF